MLHKIKVDGIYSVADESASITIDLSDILYIGVLSFVTRKKTHCNFTLFLSIAKIA
jgi:hypothetical protein